MSGMTKQQAVDHLIAKGMFVKPMVLHVRLALKEICRAG